MTQEISPGGLNLKLSNPNGLENVFGTPFSDSIFGNQRNNVLIGSGSQDILNGADGDDTLQGGATTVVFLDFDSAFDPGEHIYTDLERNEIRTRLEVDSFLFLSKWNSRYFLCSLRRPVRPIDI